MRAENGFTLAVQPAQALVELFSQRRQAVFQAGNIFRRGGDLTITFEVIALPASQSASPDATGERNAVLKVGSKPYKRTGQGMRNVRRVAGGNTVAVDKRAGEIRLQHASGLLLVAAVNFQHAAVIKQRTGTDQRQRAFGIRVGVKPSVDKTDVAAPCAALLF